MVEGDSVFDPEKTSSKKPGWRASENPGSIMLGRFQITNALSLIGLVVMTFTSFAAVPPPTLVPRGGFFTSNVLVTIAGPTNQVRYTLDGTEPGTNAPLYSAPLLITNSAQLKARVFESGTNAGQIVAEAYSVLDTNVAGFSSTLPLIVLNSFGQPMPPVSNAVIWMHVFSLATNQRATLLGATAEFSGPISIKARGFTSLRQPKKSYAVETLDAAGENAPVSLLGMPADHDWILYAPYADKTMLRDVLAYELSNRLGHYASRTRFVEVFINDSTNQLARAHYAGVYVLEEKIKVATNRVSLSKLSPKHEAEPEISGGYLFKKDHLEKVLGEVPADGPARSKPPSLSGPLPSGPGGFPAAVAGFLPPAPHPAFSNLLSAVTNSVMETNLVAGTNVLVPVLSVIAIKTNYPAVTNLVSLTNAVPATNLVVVTNSLVATNFAVVTNAVPATNAVVASQSVSGTNQVATTNLVDSITAVITTTVSITASTTYRTNFVAVTNLVVVTNATVVTNLLVATNAVAVTNLVVAAVPVITTNAVLVTNVFRIGPPTPSALALKLEATGQGFNTAYANAFFYVDPKPTKITAGQRAWLGGYLNRLELALYGQDFRSPSNGYAAYLEVDSFIDHHLFVEATKNVDGFRFSTYFTKERGGKLKMEPVWDWNLSFGNAKGKQGYQSEHWYWPQLDDQQYSWYRRLFEDPEFGQRYVDRWAQWRTNVFATSNLLGRVDQMAAALQEPAARNFERWPILGVVIEPNYEAGKTYAEEIQMLKTWLTNRVAWMDAQFVPPPVVTRVPDAASSNLLQFTAPTGQVFITTDGSDPRAADGSTSTVAQAVQAPVAVTNAAKVIARTRSANRWSSPVSARVPVQP